MVHFFCISHSKSDQIGKLTTNRESNINSNCIVNSTSNKIWY